LLLLSVVAVTAFCAAFHTLFSADYWFHLRGGAEIWAGRIPRVDAFSFPSAGQPYIDLHWLFQAVLYGVHELGGVTLAIWFKTTLVLATFALLYRVTRREAPASVAAVVCGLAVILASERFQVRPELMTFLALAISLWLIRRHDEGWRMAAWLFPILQLLWVNMEGLFVLGYVVLGAALIDRRRDRRLWIAFGASIAAAFLNPYFAEGALHPIVLFSRIDGSMAIYSSTISEFLGPFEGNIGHPAVTLFPWFLGALAVSLALSRRPRLSEIVLLSAFVVLSFQARRNLALLAIVSAPILARWIALIPERREIRECRSRLPASLSRALPRAATGIALLGFVLFDFGLVTNRTYARIETNREFGTGIAALAVPAEAAAFLREHQVAGPVFSTLSDGSYLIWADPERPAFVDGRLEVHSAQHYAEYLSTLSGGAGWESIDQRYRFGAILLDHAEAPLLARERASDPAWAAVYLDPKSVILVRRDTAHAVLIEATRYDQARILKEFPPLTANSEALVPPSPGWVTRQLSAVHVPWRELAMGQFLNRLGAIESAAEQFRRAAFVSPVLGSSRILLATALSQAGRSEDALHVLDSAANCFLTPDDRMRIFATRGDLLLRAERGVEAAAAYDQYLVRDSRSPDSGIVQANRGWARLLQGDAAGAARDLIAGLERQPGYLEAWRLLGMAHESEGRRTEALAAYQTYERNGGQSAEVAEAIARLSSLPRER
jgi:tetratricopeptide (TPR) repeat protein